MTPTAGLHLLQGQSSFLGAGGGIVSQQLLELMRSGSLGNGMPANLDWGNLYPMRALAAAAQGQGNADIPPNPGSGPALLAAMSAAQRGQQQAQQQQAQPQLQQPPQQPQQPPQQQPQQQDSRRALAASLLPRSSSPKAAASGSAPHGGCLAAGVVGCNRRLHDGRGKILGSAPPQWRPIVCTVRDS